MEIMGRGVTVGTDHLRQAVDLSVQRQIFLPGGIIRPVILYRDIICQFIGRENFPVCVIDITAGALQRARSGRHDREAVRIILSADNLKMKQPHQKDQSQNSEKQNKDQSSSAEKTDECFFYLLSQGDCSSSSSFAVIFLFSQWYRK